MDGPMKSAHFRCGLGCGDIAYSPELYGSEGPIPLHHVLVHETNESGAVNAALTVGLMSEKGARAVTPQETVPLTDEERWEHLQEALRIKQRAEALAPVLRHYSRMAMEALEEPRIEALGERVSIPVEKLDALLLELNQRRAGEVPTIDSDLLVVPGVAS